MKVGDRVNTKNGKGTIVHINTRSVTPYLVEHDTWTGGHSGSMRGKQLGTRGYFYSSTELEKIGEKKMTVLLVCSTLTQSERIVGVYEDRAQAETDAKLLRKAMPNRHIAVLEFEYD